MTLADVLTDEFIARVANRVVDLLKRQPLRSGFDDVSNAIEAALVNERQSTYRFVIEVKGPEALAKVDQLRQMGGVRMSDILAEIASRPLPGTDQRECTLTWMERNPDMVSVEEFHERMSAAERNWRESPTVAAARSRCER